MAETVDGELIVTLPLVENIPWVAALAGGLPIAAGTYLVSKVFEEQVNRLSSGVYSVRGDLKSPEVLLSGCLMPHRATTRLKIKRRCGRLDLGQRDTEIIFWHALFVFPD